MFHEIPNPATRQTLDTQVLARRLWYDPQGPQDGNHQSEQMERTSWHGLNFLCHLKQPNPSTRMVISTIWPYSHNFMCSEQFSTHKTKPHETQILTWTRLFPRPKAVSIAESQATTTHLLTWGSKYLEPKEFSKMSLALGWGAQLLLRQSDMKLAYRAKVGLLGHKELAR